MNEGHICDYRICVDNIPERYKQKKDSPQVPSTSEGDTERGRLSSDSKVPQNNQDSNKGNIKR